MSEDSRRYERVIQELDVTLLELDGSTIDERAVADDISPVGFRCVTRADLAKDAKVAFAIRLQDDSLVRGQAVVVWVESDRWGGRVLGVKITKMSWGDRGRLRRRISRPGYDFVALARMAVIALFWIILAAGVHNIAFYQPEIRHTLAQMGPVFGAVVLMALGFWILTR